MLHHAGADHHGVNKHFTFTQRIEARHADVGTQDDSRRDCLLTAFDSLKTEALRLSRLLV